MVGQLPVEVLHWGTIAAAVSSFVFLLGSTWVFPWYDSLAGRAMVAIDAALFVALFPALLHFVAGINTETPFFVWYYGLSFWVVAGVTIWRLLALVLVQRNGRLRRRRKDGGG